MSNPETTQPSQSSDVVRALQKEDIKQKNEFKVMNKKKHTHIAAPSRAHVNLCN